MELSILRHSYTMNDKEGFFNRFIMQMCQIRDCAYPRNERLAYDKSYEAIFQNLLETKYAKESLENLISNHLKDIDEGKDGIRNGSQIDIKNPIDDNINMHFKDFFIRGKIAINCLIRHSRFMGSNIGFLFDDDAKKYEKGLKRFTLKGDDKRFIALSSMIKDHQKNWFIIFNKTRAEIEHEGFKLSELKYILEGDKLKTIFPTHKGQGIKEILEICWENLINLCEEIMVFLLSLKIKNEMVIVFIPENMRNKYVPVRYEVRLKNFPQAKFSCS